MLTLVTWEALSYPIHLERINLLRKVWVVFKKLEDTKNLVIATKSSRDTLIMEEKIAQKEEVT
jgi:hypothetical protein